ncbi:MAG: tRNA (adenosine(37)-N6)-dimethylallyltransferase MiaA [Pseudomonadota bacterium]
MDNNPAHHILILLGPTAVGKTAVACALSDVAASRLPSFPGGVHIISVDSAMVYRGLDIGSAKPSQAEQVQYPHALIDICDPSQVYTAADFVSDADREIEQAWTRGQLPVLVGGTMLYARRFIEGIAPLPSSDEDLRSDLSERYAREGADVLHAELAAADPQAAAQIHPHNAQRLLRALEVITLSGQPISKQWSEQMSWQDRLGGLLHTAAIVPLDRTPLYDRIEQRFDAMLEAGFVEEVSRLQARGDLSPQLPSIRAVGYRQCWAFLAGEIDEATFRQQAIVATRRLAKRQMTWLRSWKNIQQIPWGDPQALAMQVVGQIMAR